MWNLKCTIAPVIIGATGIVTRSLGKNLEDDIIVIIIMSAYIFRFLPFWCFV
jgi:hypothetical protein